MQSCDFRELVEGFRMPLSAFAMQATRGYFVFSLGSCEIACSSKK